MRILREVDASEVDAVERQASWRSHTAGELIVHHLDAGRDVYFLVSGRARVVVYSQSGKEVSYREIAAGDVFGEFAAIDGLPRSASVIALEDCVVASLTTEKFWSVVTRCPQVAAALLKHLTRLVRFYSDRIREFATMPVGLRVRLELLRLVRGAASEGNRALIAPAPTHSEIASRTGTHREAVTRELNLLRREGFISMQKREIRVEDVARFEASLRDAIGELVVASLD